MHCFMGHGRRGRGLKRATGRPGEEMQKGELREAEEGTWLMELEGATESASLAATAARRRRRTDGRRFQRQSPSFVATVDRRSREQMRCRAPGGCKGKRGGRTGRPVSANRPTDPLQTCIACCCLQSIEVDGRAPPTPLPSWMLDGCGWAPEALL